MTTTPVSIDAERPQRASAAGVPDNFHCRSIRTNPIMEALEKQLQQPVYLLPAPHFQCAHCQDTGLEYSSRWDGSQRAYPCLHCEEGQRMARAEQAAIWHDTILTPAERAGREPAPPPPTAVTSSPVDEMDEQVISWGSLSIEARAVLLAIAHPIQPNARWIPVSGASTAALQELDDELLIAYVEPTAEARLTPKGRHLVSVFLSTGWAI